MRERLVGTWRLISLRVGEGPRALEPFGADPKGLMVMDGRRLSIIITRSSLPTIAAGNREQATPQESQTIVHGSIAYFGTYTFDDTSRTLTAHIEASTFPNFVGQAQQRLIDMSGDELTYVNASPSGGGGIARAVWKRST